MPNWGGFSWGDGSVYGEIEPGLIYRLPLLRYRDGSIYRGSYRGPGAGAGEGVALPRRPAASLKIYDREGLKLAEVTSNSGRQLLHKLSFELLPTGPGQLQMELTDLPRWADITHETRVDVHLWNSPTPIYSGFVQEPPLPGGTEFGYDFEGHGFFQHLERVLVTATYQHQLVHVAVDDVIRRFVEPQTRVVYNAGKILPSTYEIVGPLKFIRTPAKQVLKQLGNLAGGYEWGVDERREFWFGPEDTTVLDAARAWVGKHVESAVFRADSRNVVNRMYVVLGQVRNDLATDHPLYKTNHLEDPLEAAGAGGSQEIYGIREGTHRAPGVLTPTDAVRSAAVDLARKKDPIQRGTVKGIEFQGDQITCRGRARITSRDGRTAYVLPLKRVRYRVEGARVAVELELGDLEPRPYHFEGELVARQAAEELARQASQPQL